MVARVRVNSNYNRNNVLIVMFGSLYVEVYHVVEQPENKENTANKTYRKKYVGHICIICRKNISGVARNKVHLRKKGYQKIVDIF